MTSRDCAAEVYVRAAAGITLDVMVLDEADRAWIRYVATRDQLLAARDEDNRKTEPTALATTCPDDLAAIDIRAIEERLRIR